MQIRNRGPIVGSIAHADLAAEMHALLTCLNGEVVAQSSHGERIIKAEEFFTGNLSTALKPGEMLTEVHFPWIARQAGGAFMDIAPQSGDCSVRGATTRMTTNLHDTRISCTS